MLKRVLIVEDNRHLVASLFAYLEARDYVLDAAQDGPSGIELATGAAYDAIVLDWMLPRLEGDQVLKTLRARGCTTPILMLTARDDLPHKLAGFRAGADDYVTKPFAFAELDVRLNALILRAKGRQQILQVGDLKYEISTQKVTRQGARLQLQASGRLLLEELMRTSPAVVPRARLEFVVWGRRTPISDMLRSHIYELRKAVDGPFAEKLIHTVPKVGYRIGRGETSE
jgi:DNA-binding response OmpR family regulator